MTLKIFLTNIINQNMNKPCHNNVLVHTYTCIASWTGDSFAGEISANSPVPSLCFIQTLGSSDTMKKLLYGMLTLFFFIPLWKFAGIVRHLAWSCATSNSPKGLVTTDASLFMLRELKKLLVSLLL